MKTGNYILDQANANEKNPILNMKLFILKFTLLFTKKYKEMWKKSIHQEHTKNNW